VIVYVGTVPSCPEIRERRSRTRLDAEYGSQARTDVVIAEERRRFEDASIRSFLPILIERSVRSRLATTHA
jgi:hypothetical protein